MIPNDVIQKALISRLKSDTDLVTALGGSTEVREQQWQGRQFNYPAVRVAIGVQVPDIRKSPCNWSRISFSVLCFSEERSSHEADHIAGLVNAALHDKAFDVAADGFRFHKIRSLGLVSARRASERIWAAEAFFDAEIHTI